MKIEEYFQEEDLKNAKKIFKEFHGRMLLNLSIKNPSILVLSIFMVSNKNNQPMVEKKDVRELFISLGKKSEEFDKTLYEISGKRKGKKKFIDSEKDKIGLNFNGIEQIKKILEN